ncbi:MAG: sulfatase-like hydrolase/transferase [Acidimicrobiia bacterium]|nr:sulfatase-like hydrolase/transferase [Acidimicrobiia bacterium]
MQATYPQNLFTVFGGNYDVFGFEQLTDLCGATLCPDSSPDDARLFLDDTTVVFKHLVYPQRWADNLPAIDRTWSSFGSGDSADPRTSILGADQIVEGGGISKFGNRTKHFDEFVDAIEPGTTPSLYFVHTAMPHQPWEYDPAGQLYSGAGDIPGLRGLFWLDNSESQVQAGYQRHLMQLEYADELLGEALDKLEETGRFDDALIAVTADHGAGFESGQGFREFSDGNHAALYHVPVFIKEPGQTQGAINDSFGQTIDIVPTIADMVDLPWPATDGQSMLSDTIDPGLVRCIPVKVSRVPYRNSTWTTWPTSHASEAGFKTLISRSASMPSVQQKSLLALPSVTSRPVPASTSTSLASTTSGTPISPADTRLCPFVAPFRVRQKARPSLSLSTAPSWRPARPARSAETTARSG